MSVSSQKQGMVQISIAVYWNRTKLKSLAWTKSVQFIFLMNYYLISRISLTETSVTEKQAGLQLMSIKKKSLIKITLALESRPF